MYATCRQCAHVKIHVLRWAQAQQGREACNTGSSGASSYSFGSTPGSCRLKPARTARRTSERMLAMLQLAPCSLQQPRRARGRVPMQILTSTEQLRCAALGRRHRSQHCGTPRAVCVHSDGDEDRRHEEPPDHRRSPPAGRRETRRATGSDSAGAGADDKRGSQGALRNEQPRGLRAAAAQACSTQPGAMQCSGAGDLLANCGSPPAVSGSLACSSIRPALCGPRLRRRSRPFPPARLRRAHTLLTTPRK